MFQACELLHASCHHSVCDAPGRCKSAVQSASMLQFFLSKGKRNSWGIMPLVNGGHWLLQDLTGECTLFFAFFAPFLRGFFCTNIATDGISENLENFQYISVYRFFPHFFQYVFFFDSAGFCFPFFLSASFFRNFWFLTFDIWHWHFSSFPAFSELVLFSVPRLLTRGGGISLYHFTGRKIVGRCGLT